MRRGDLVIVSPIRYKSVLGYIHIDKALPGAPVGAPYFWDVVVTYDETVGLLVSNPNLWNEHDTATGMFGGYFRVGRRSKTYKFRTFKVLVGHDILDIREECLCSAKRFL